MSRLPNQLVFILLTVTQSSSFADILVSHWQSSSVPLIPPYLYQYCSNIHSDTDTDTETGICIGIGIGLIVILLKKEVLGHKFY